MRHSGFMPTEPYVEPRVAMKQRLGEIFFAPPARGYHMKRRREDRAAGPKQIA